MSAYNSLNDVATTIGKLGLDEWVPESVRSGIEKAIFESGSDEETDIKAIIEEWPVKCCECGDKYPLKETQSFEKTWEERSGDYLLDHGTETKYICGSCEYIYGDH